MAILLQVTCLTFFLSMIYGWGFSTFDESYPSTYFDGPFDDYWSSLPTFDDSDEIMDRMQQNFQRMFARLSSLSKANVADMDEAKKKLNAIEPVCTTKINSPTTTTSIENNRRKQFRTTQTTTCVKELVIDGTKHIYTEQKVTDDKGIIISKSNYYQSFPVDTSDNIMSPDDTIDDTTSPNDTTDDTTSSNDTIDDITSPNDTIDDTTSSNDTIDNTTFPINTVDDTTFPTDIINNTTFPTGTINNTTLPIDTIDDITFWNISK
jgi:hypothetical protein